MKIILDEEDFEYMNRIRNSDKLIMQKGAINLCNTKKYHVI